MKSRFLKLKRAKLTMLFPFILSSFFASAQFSVTPTSQATICSGQGTATFSISQNNSFPYNETVDLSSIVNSTDNPNSPPTGSITHGGIPFYVSSPNTSWNSHIAVGLGSGVVSTTIDIPCPKSVDAIYTLINTGWGETNPNVIMTYLELNFTNGASAQIPLDGDLNIRDHRDYNFANNIGSSTNNGFPITTQKVWSTIYNGDEYRRDMQTITIPSPYNSYYLNSVTLIDSGDNGVHRSFITGLTLHATAPASITWHSGSPTGPVVSAGPAPTYTISVSPSVNTTYYAVSDGGGCVETANVDVMNCCSDTCFWKVTGNNILNGNNVFGTLSSNSVDIQTEGSDRGIYTPGGSNATDPIAGRFGWNTMNPTARLHVNCEYGNEDGSGQSDIRFENLEQGEGEILVISPDGYVFNSHMPIEPGGGVTNNCGIMDFVTKTDPAGDLQCSQIYDDGISVGINKTSGFNYSGGGVFTAGSPTPGNVVLDVNGMFRSITMVATSDAKYKRDVLTIENSLEKVLQMNPVKYYWKDIYTDKGFDKFQHTGFIAQELGEVLPNSVIKDDNGDYAVDYNSVIPVLTQAIQEQNIIINKLRDRIEQLENNTHTEGVELKGNVLYQNTPNPFGSETEIKYEINSVQHSAYIIVYDLNGRELMKFQVEKGVGSIIVSSEKLVAGMYLYALVIDGQPIDTKRMVFSN